MFEYLSLFAIALILTMAIEVGIAWLFRLRSKKELLTVILINVITNPLLNYLILLNSHFHLIDQTNVIILALEVCVCLAEWRLLLWALRQGAKKMLVLSLTMNACSYAAGLLIFNYILQ
jgi:hypothetical protein